MKLVIRAMHKHFKPLDNFGSQIKLAGLTSFISLLLLFFPVFLPAWEGRYTGIRYGETIKVLHDGQETKVRLAFIDCPERGQPFSKRAEQFTSDLVFEKTVRVDPVNTDRYGILIPPDG